MKRHFTGLWLHPDFMKLWIAQTVSEFGSRITRDGLPLIAVIVLAASPAQMGLLTAAASVPVLLFGLVAGVWIDRLRRRPILIALDVTRAVLLLTIPLAAFSGWLTFELLLLVAGAMALLGMIFDITYRAYLPTLIDRTHVLEGNTRLATTDSLAEIGGPAIGGLLIQWMSAPFAIVWDALTFAFSAVMLSRIRQPEPPPAPAEMRESVWREMVGGFRVVAREPILRALLISVGVRNFFGAFFGVLYSLYVIRDLGMSPVELGVVVGMGGVGALLGAGIAPRLRGGVGRVMVGALLFGALVNFLIPLASGIWVFPMLVAAQILGDAAMMVFAINEMSLRQMLIPDRLLGRANSLYGFLMEGVAPVGALAAGALAAVFDVRGTLLIAALGILGSAVYILLSPALHAISEVETVKEAT